MDRRGFTMVELLIASTLFVILMGVVAQLYFSMNGASNVMTRKVAARDEARKAIQAISDEVRQAAAASVANVPGETLTYKIAVDVDGNGSAVDASGAIELSGAHTLTRDYDDANQDGVRETQLILVTAEGSVRVLANALFPNEDRNTNGTLDADEDANGDGVLNRGLWFESAPGGVLVTVETRSGTKFGNSAAARLSAFVAPRN
jgi:prepilin-type N-terminal cleavage/methylation domain-containing protein